MRLKVSYTLLRDWHAAGIATSVMSLLYVTATFPWGKGFYLFITEASASKSILALILSYFIFKAIARTLITGLWYLAVPWRENPVFARLVCAPDAHRASADELNGFKRGMSAQYAATMIFLVAAGFSLILSIFIALGASAFVPLNYTILTLGGIATVWGFLSQLYMRLPLLRASKGMQRITFMTPRQRERRANL